jgi:hypothetical protein
VGFPRCSCNVIMSLSPADLVYEVSLCSTCSSYIELLTSHSRRGSVGSCYHLKIGVPSQYISHIQSVHGHYSRFNRTDVGNSKRISLENVPSLEEGSRDVVTRILGSTTPLSCEYSSSSPSSSSAVLSALLSSYLGYSQSTGNSTFSK